MVGNQIANKLLFALHLQCDQCKVVRVHDMLKLDHQSLAMCLGRAQVKFLVVYVVQVPAPVNLR